MYKYFHQNGEKAPTKKLRGIKRVEAKVFRAANEYAKKLNFSSWFDMWHAHMDWEGYGNLGWKYRKLYLEGLIELYKITMANKDIFKTNFQVLIMLNEKDSGQDAIFIHTPNPNDNNYPYKCAKSVWGIPEIESYFESKIGNVKFRAGVSEWMGSKVYTIYSPQIGETVE